jgi:hypothetical protein
MAELTIGFTVGFGRPQRGGRWTLVERSQKRVGVHGEESRATHGKEITWPRPDMSNDIEI